jgi:hypothetical protein
MHGTKFLGNFNHICKVTSPIPAPTKTVNSRERPQEGALLCHGRSRLRPWQCPSSHKLRRTIRSHSPHALGRRRNPRLWLKPFFTSRYRMQLQPPGLGTRAARLDVLCGAAADLLIRIARPSCTAGLRTWGPSSFNPDCT